MNNELTMTQWGEIIKPWRESKGFITPATLEGKDADLMLGKLMLIVTEIAEAAEAVRKHDIENFEEELADAIIRILDIFVTQKLNPDLAVSKKMNINYNRPFKHGKKVNL